MEERVFFAEGNLLSSTMQAKWAVKLAHYSLSNAHPSKPKKRAAKILGSSDRSEMEQRRVLLLAFFEPLIFRRHLKTMLMLLLDLEAFVDGRRHFICQNRFLQIWPPSVDILDFSAPVQHECESRAGLGRLRRRRAQACWTAAAGGAPARPPGQNKTSFSVRQRSCKHPEQHLVCVLFYVFFRQHR